MRNEFHGRFRPVAVAFFLSVVGTFSVASLAGSCGELEAERSRAQTDMLRLVADYPGTHAMLLGCAGAASDDYQRTGSRDSATGTFLVCAGIGCALVGFENCSAIAKEWFVLYGRSEQLTQRMRALGCPA